MTNTLQAASALTEALIALKRAEESVKLALFNIGAEGGEPKSCAPRAQLTTGAQIMAVLSSHSEPLTLAQIADGVIALRNGEDEPKRGGGTRYQELCRTSIARLISKRLVRRVDAENKNDFVRFAAA